jgi:3-methyladenine DNA glycosylase AlkD
MNKNLPLIYYKEIFNRFKANKCKPNRSFPRSYCGNHDPSFNIPSKTERKIAKDFTKKYKDININNFIELLNILYKARTSTEKGFGGKLLEYYPKLRKSIDPNHIYKWLDNLNGWCEVDSIAQSTFTPNDILYNWKKWKLVIIKLYKSKNLNKKRASLVLLTKPVRQSKDKRFLKLAFQTIDRLKFQKSILITKAVSWLLRDMIKNYRKDVIIYLNKNESTLPKIALRETKRKLKTGRK